MRTQEGFWHWNVQRILGIAATCGLLWVSSVSASAQTYLYNRADFPTGKSPSSVVTADFNGDGIPDLAVANQADNTVSILLGKSSGGFAAHVDYATGSSPVALVAADFNGDGKLDLAIVNSQANTVSILIGNGDGTFGDHTDYAVGNKPIAIVAADFNGDGKIDLAVANNKDSTLSVLLGNGDGTFQNESVIPTAGCYSLAGGDFNGDGKEDLVVMGSTLSVFLSNGDGTFHRVDSTLGAAKLGYFLTVGDFNRDGKLDVATSALTGIGQPVVLLGNGDGTFQIPASISSSYNLVHAIIAADFNGDGKLDLAFTEPGAVLEPTLVTVLGNGDGTFAYTNKTAVPMPSFATTATPMLVGDFNGDGVLNLAAVDPGANCVSIFLGNGDGTFGKKPVFDAASTGNTGPEIVADFNGDGKPDVAVGLTGSPSGTVSVFLGKGDGTLQNSVSSPVANSGATVMVAGDFNEDEKTDLAVDDGSGVDILLGNGDGSFQTPIVTNVGANLTVLNLVAGDFNGDGKLDLAAVVSQSLKAQPVIVILLGHGDGTFAIGSSYTMGVPLVGSGAGSLVATDFNKDGKVDLAFTESGTGFVDVLMGNGDGSFQSPISYPIGPSDVLLAGDVNSDGKLDLVGMSGMGTSVLLGNGDGTFQNHIDSMLPGQGFSGGYNLVSAAIADFNGDGKLDVASYGAATTAILLGNGDGTFGPPFTYVGGSNYGVVTAGDFNGDGTADLAIATVSTSPVAPTVGLLLSAPVAAVCPGSLSASPGSVCAPGLAFPNTNVHRISGDSHDVVVLSNSGNALLKITSSSASGDFAVGGGTCGTTLAVGAACQIGLNFSPTAEGTRTGVLIITDNATPSPQAVSLTGVGVAPVASLSVSSLNFSSQSLGTTSSAQSVVLTNKGNASLDIVSIGYGGDFAQTNNCGGSVAIGASCTISVTFTPSAVGPRSDTLTIQDNAAGSPQSVTLTGTGLSAPVVSLSPTGLNFGSEIVGGTTAAQNVTLKNTGTAALGITSIAAGGDFTATNSCGASVAAGGSCAISITFKPSAGGNQTGTVTITDNAPSSPQMVALQGSGQDFSLSVPSGTPTSASISPGGTAAYSINIAGVGGLNGAVTFGCTGAPSEATCSVSPGSLTPGSTASVLTVTVTTAAPSILAPLAPPGSGKGWRLLALGLSALLLVVFGWPARHRPSPIALWQRCLALSAALMLILGMAACGGGGGGSSGGGGNPGTPAGAYTLTVSGSVTEASTTVTHNMSLTLNVQ